MCVCVSVHVCSAYGHVILYHIFAGILAATLLRFFLLCLAWSNFFVASTSWRRICRQNSPARQPSAVQQPAQPRPGRDPLKDIRKPYKYKLIKIMPACPLPVCVCVCPPRRQQRLLSCICCWPTLFIYILFHFILFHFMLAFFCCLPLLLLLSRAGVMNCFTYTLNMQHMFLAVDALNIYMQSQCPFCGTFIVSLSVCVSRYVCVCVRATNYFRPTADGVASFECEQISNAVAVSSVATPHNNRQKFAATFRAKNRQSHLLVPKNTLNTEFN